MSAEEKFDVAVVGLGPVGQTLAILLAMRGHRVLVVEKHAAPYELPRAVHYDPDISRLLDGIGAPGVSDFSRPTDVYEWQNAARQTLLRFSLDLDSDQGWPGSTMFNQPGLERSLRRRGGDFANITVRRGATATAVVQESDGVRLDVRDGSGDTVYRARFLVGCDGANSMVRDACAFPIEDLGFNYNWLILDVIPTVEMTWEPENLQICDPERPVSAVSGGPGRRRFEFMQMPTDGADFNSDETAWSLLADWNLTPGNARLERRALYTFRARWAKSWRDGRVFLAGDAAHQVPPFYGQGMVAGLRDSVNLAWKFDLVLRGLAGDALLDTYGSERTVHAQHTIWMSVELGRLICETDPAGVRRLHEHFLANGPEPERALPEAPPERLGPGAFAIEDPTVSPCVGLLGVNGRVTFDDGSTDLLDRRTFGSFLVVADSRVVDAGQLAAALRSAPSGLDIKGFRVLAADASQAPTGDEIRDEQGRYLRWLDGDAARVVRPDFYVFGAAARPQDLPDVMASLSTALATPSSTTDGDGPFVATRV